MQRCFSPAPTLSRWPTLASRDPACVHDRHSASAPACLCRPALLTAPPPRPSCPCFLAAGGGGARGRGRECWATGLGCRGPGLRRCLPSTRACAGGHSACSAGCGSPYPAAAGRPRPMPANPLVPCSPRTAANPLLPLLPRLLPAAKLPRPPGSPPLPQLDEDDDDEAPKKRKRADDSDEGERSTVSVPGPLFSTAELAGNCCVSTTQERLPASSAWRKTRAGRAVPTHRARHLVTRVAHALPGASP